HYILPFSLHDALPIFYTNGHDIYFWDLENYPPQKVFGFPTRDDLERYAYIRKSRKPLTGELINTKIAGRTYQIQSIRAVMEAVRSEEHTSELQSRDKL